MISRRRDVIRQARPTMRDGGAGGPFDPQPAALSRSPKEHVGQVGCYGNAAWVSPCLCRALEQHPCKSPLGPHKHAIFCHDTTPHQRSPCLSKRGTERVWHPILGFYQQSLTNPGLLSFRFERHNISKTYASSSRWSADTRRWRRRRGRAQGGPAFAPEHETQLPRRGPEPRGPRRYHRG